MSYRDKPYRSRGYRSSNRDDSGDGGYSRDRRSSGSRRGGGRNFRSNNRRGNRNNFRKKIDYDKYVYVTKVEETEKEYIPNTLYKDLPINETLKANILRKGYEKPTPIQDQAIPVIMSGKDVLGLANTGTGKTAAFLIPLIDKSINNRKENKTLIIVPTRELAEQVEKEFISLKRDTGLRSCLCIGGQNIRKQIYTINKGFDFIVGTPGRLKDLEDRNILNLNLFNNIVLDEVDRMLDMGFVNEIKYIISKLSDDRHSLFFSATIDKRTEDIIHEILNNPVRIQIKTKSPLLFVDQDIIKVKNRKEKDEKLYDMLVTDETMKKVIVFCQTKRACDDMVYFLKDRDIAADAIHGDKSQYIRTKVLKKFREERVRVLVATDVAARGIDVKNVTHVVNYDEPNNYEDYTHRVGRTGRAGQKGQAYTFVVVKDRDSNGGNRGGNRGYRGGNSDSRGGNRDRGGDRRGSRDNYSRNDRGGNRDRDSRGSNSDSRGGNRRNSRDRGDRENRSHQTRVYPPRIYR